MCTRQDSNLGPDVYKTSALPTELRVRVRSYELQYSVIRMRRTSRQYGNPYACMLYGITDVFLPQIMNEYVPVPAIHILTRRDSQI